MCFGIFKLAFTLSLLGHIVYCINILHFVDILLIFQPKMYMGFCQPEHMLEIFLRQLSASICL